MAEENLCEKCKGTFRVKEKDGTIHVCFSCLKKGLMDQHDKKIKDASELGMKL